MRQEKGQRHHSIKAACRQAGGLSGIIADMRGGGLLGNMQNAFCCYHDCSSIFYELPRRKLLASSLKATAVRHAF